MQRNLSALQDTAGAEALRPSSTASSSSGTVLLPGSHHPAPEVGDAEKAGSTAGPRAGLLIWEEKLLHRGERL